MKLTEEQEASIARLQVAAKEYSDASELCSGAYAQYKASAKRADDLRVEYQAAQEEVIQILAGQKVASDATDA